jgi:hypothetical protein
VYGLHPSMPSGYILLVIGSNYKEGNPMRVLTSRVSELKKLQDDKLQSKVKLGIQ